MQTFEVFLEATRGSPCEELQQYDPLSPYSTGNGVRVGYALGTKNILKIIVHNNSLRILSPPFPFPTNI